MEVSGLKPEAGRAPQDAWRSQVSSLLSNHGSPRCHSSLDSCEVLRLPGEMNYGRVVWVLLHGEASTHLSFLALFILLKQVSEAHLNEPSSLYQRAGTG